MKTELNKGHYDLLISCCEDQNFTKWNEFVSSYEGIIRLRNGDFSGRTIRGASFRSLHEKGADFFGANLKNTIIEGADLSKSFLMEADLENAKISCSCLDQAILRYSNIKNCNISMTSCNSADFSNADMSLVDFFNTSLYEANFTQSKLSSARIYNLSRNPLLPGTEIRTNLCGASFSNALFDEKTYFGCCSVSQKTDFRTATFNLAHFSPGLKQTLMYCNRRHSWHDWYETQKPISIFIAKCFWYLSDYGFSIKRIIVSFISACSFFSIIYCVFPFLIDGLNGRDVIGSIYFSVVTMTTLGFGDMHASPCWIAQILVMGNVVCGYVLLGALITALTNLFSIEGPAQGLVKHPNKPNGLVKTFHMAENKS